MLFAAKSLYLNHFVMKTALPFLVFMLVAVATSAQENQRSLSQVEQFCKAPDRTITGYLIFRDSYGFGASDLSALVMKYVDTQTNESLVGVTISSSLNKATGDCSVYKNYNVMFDCEEINRIISWLELNQSIIGNANAQVGYFSYTPAKGDVLLKLERHMWGKGSSYSSTRWDLIIQFNKFDADSERHISSDIEFIIKKLKEIQETFKN